MLADRAHRVVLVVLGVDGQDGAAGLHFLETGLKVIVALAFLVVGQLDALYAVFSDDAAPERVVEIEDRDLSAGFEGTAEDAGQFFRDGEDAVPGVGHAAQVPHLVRVEAAAAGLGDAVGQVVDVHGRMLVRKFLRERVPVGGPFDVMLALGEGADPAFAEIQGREENRDVRHIPGERCGGLFPEVQPFLRFGCIFPVSCLGSVEQENDGIAFLAVQTGVRTDDFLDPGVISLRQIDVVFFFQFRGDEIRGHICEECDVLFTAQVDKGLLTY